MNVIIIEDVWIDQEKVFSKDRSANVDFFWKDFLDTLNAYSVWHEILDDWIRIFAQKISLEEVQMNDLLGLLNGVTNFDLIYVPQDAGLGMKFLLHSVTKKLCTSPSRWFTIAPSTIWKPRRRSSR